MISFFSGDSTDLPVFAALRQPILRNDKISHRINQQFFQKQIIRYQPVDARFSELKRISGTEKNSLIGSSDLDTLIYANSTRLMATSRINAYPPISLLMNSANIKKSHTHPERKK